MNDEVDLQVLAVRREQDPMPVLRRHVLTRYVLPGVLVAGFATLTAWAARDAVVQQHRVTVVPVHVTRAEMQRSGTPLFQAAGWIEPRPTPIRVAALSSGVVRDLLVVEDQFVEQGEPIARLVSEDAELALAAAEARFDRMEAEISRLEAVVEAARTNLKIPAHLEVPVARAEGELARIETELATLPARVAQAEARQRLAKADLKAKQDAGEAISEVTLLAAQSEMDGASAEVQEYRTRLEVLQQERKAAVRQRDATLKRLELKTDEHQALGEATARLQAARADVHAARVSVDEAKLRLERMVVGAPVSGRVLKLLASPGTQLHVGAMESASGSSDGSTVVTMYRPEHLQVRIDVRFENLPHVGRDQPVIIASPAIESPLQGQVLFLTGFANIQKNTLEVKASIDSPPEVLKPEMLVDVTFLAPPVDSEEPADDAPYRLFVPRELVETEGGVSSVWVADVARGRSRRQTVELGEMQSGKYVEVRSGLTAGSRLIVRGREGLLGGDSIEIVGEDATLGVDESAPSLGRAAHTSGGQYHFTD